MASAAAREMEGRVARIIFDAGGIITAKEIDGAGHNCWSYRINGRDRCFHFAKTPRAMSRGTKNTYARLRREIKETDALPPPPAPVEAPPEPKQQRPAPIIAVTAPTPPSTTRLTTARRKSIAKRFLSLPSLAALMEEFGLERTQAQTLILSQRGQPAEKLRKELNQQRAEAAKRLRTNNVERKRKPRLSKRSLAKRNGLVYAYCKYGLSFKEAADLFKLTAERVRQIVRAKEKEANDVSR